MSGQLSLSGGLPLPDPSEPARLRADQIREGLEAIRAAGNCVCLVLWRAHQEQDWRSLGYRSFGAYAHSEFGIGESQAYRLVAKGTALEYLAAAARISPADMPELTERFVRRVSASLPAIAEQIVARTKRVSATRRPAIVAEVVHEATVSPAGEPLTRPISVARAAQTLIEAERAITDPQGFPAALSAAIDAESGSGSETRARWADYLADTAMALRRLGGDDGMSSAVTRRRHRTLRMTPRSGDATRASDQQLELWDTPPDFDAEDCEAGR